MTRALKVLLVEDNRDHAELITRALTRSLPSTRVKHAFRRSDCIELLDKTPFDVILMDYYLSDTTGVQLLREINQKYPKIPIIIVTGQGDERTAAKSIKAGAEDYVVKNRESLEALPRIITETIKKHQKKVAGRKKNASKKHPEEKRILSGLFKEIEQISFSLRSIYKDLNGHGKKSKKAPHKIKKIPLIQKQMESLKSVVRKLFRGGQ
jgi:DNA-binding NtrC family response regulator